MKQRRRSRGRAGGRKATQQRRATLSDHEALVLGTLYFYGEERGCYGVEAQTHIAATHRLSIGPGSLYVMLRRLVAKRLAKRVGEPEYYDDEVAAKRDQRRRRAGRLQFYCITPRGTAALRAKVKLLTPLFKFWSSESE